MFVHICDKFFIYIRFYFLDISTIENLDNLNISFYIFISFVVSWTCSMILEGILNCTSCFSSHDLWFRGFQFILWPCLIILFSLTSQFLRIGKCMDLIGQYIQMLYTHFRWIHQLFLKKILLAATGLTSKFLKNGRVWTT